MDSSHLLIIDDDVKFTRLLGGYLRRYGYVVEAVHDGEQGLERARKGNYAAIILDVLLPKRSGLDLLQELRRDSATPVLMLTALGDEPDRIAGLEVGADDYLPKTFSMRELLARLRAVVRRSTLTARAPAGEKPLQPAPLEVGNLQIDLGTHAATLGGRTLSLTAFEFDLLVALAQAYPRVKSREQLLQEVSERDQEAFDRSIDVRIAALRRKLGDDARSPRIIETVRGVGYRLRNPAAPREDPL
jgi:DNA-binding response OmpR family regulator